MTTRVDVFLQYYKPHVSGLTNMAAALAESAADEGYEVHVHCIAAHGDGSVRVDNGVTVHTYRKSFSLSRANFSLPFLRAARRLRAASGIVHLHLPLPEAGYLARLLGHRPLLITYQCDAPRSSFTASLIARALDISHTSAIRRAQITCTSTDDYAAHSRLRRVFETVDRRAVVATAVDRSGGSSTRYAIEGRRQIGFLGRPTSEKGIDVLMSAIERLPDDVTLSLAGPLEGLSESVSYDREKLERMIQSGRVRSLGFLEEADIADFYASIDVLALPSTNSFEAFGIVQVEAMSAGTPVVASDLPGVRTIVQATGLGEIACPGEPAALADALDRALNSEYDMADARRILVDRYLPPVPENAYLDLYRELLSAAPA